MTRPRTPASSFGIDAARLADLVAGEVHEPSSGGLFRGLRAWRDRLDTILSVVTDGVVVLDFTGAVVYANAPACDLLGIDDASAVLGDDLDALFAKRRALQEDGSALGRDALPGRVRSRDPTQEERLVALEAPGEALRWAMARVVPMWDAERRAAAVILVLRDVTEARRAEERLRILADAGALIGTQLDVRSTIEGTARLLVPGLADAAVVVLHGELGGAASRLPRIDEAAIEAVRAWCPMIRGAARVLTPGAREWPPFATEAGLAAVIVAPLTARGGELGALVLLSERRGYDALDLDTAADVARRAALAVDVALAYRRLEDANRQLNDADRKKDEFLAILAHELRNPLTPMLTIAELLRVRGASADLDELVPILERQAKHMARLLDDLLDVSRVMHGKIDLRRSRVELTAVIAAAIETSGPLLASRQHQLTVEVPEGLVLDADALRLTQVFANLLHNAAKYTDEGGRIAVRAHDEGDRAVVAIEDSGIGISADFLPRVFDLFAQDHGGRRHGLGVGLHMVRALVELHGGAVEAHSDGVGRGSRFTVTLPRSVANAPARRGGPAGVAAPTLRDVLVVDDDVDVASVLGNVLRRLGCEARVAHDGAAALAMARERAPDLVILDLGMPGMSGFDVARELRSMGLSSIRIVALSGYAQPGDRRRALDSGCDLHVAKPAPISVLSKLVSGAEVDDG